MRLQERYVEFDVAALKEAVSKHTGRGRVVNLRKLAEGGFNRVFLLTLENDFQVIVKIPYNLSVPKKYATASEVATLTFLRSKGFPIPKVYGYSATADNAVGVEYIVMELASGIGLDTKWFNMTKLQQRNVTLGIVDMETKLFSFPFGSVGSLYFKKDIPSEVQADLYVSGTADPDGDSNTFCIGPIADYMFWFGKRAEFEIDHGPCTFLNYSSTTSFLMFKLTVFIGREPLDYLLAIGKRELGWTQKFGKPLEKDFPYNTLLPGVISPEAYSALLQKYLAIAPYLLPTDPRNPGNQPTIRHPGTFISI